MFQRRSTMPGQLTPTTPNHMTPTIPGQMTSTVPNQMTPMMPGQITPTMPGQMTQTTHSSNPIGHDMRFLQNDDYDSPPDNTPIHGGPPDSTVAV